MGTDGGSGRQRNRRSGAWKRGTSVVREHCCESTRRNSTAPPTARALSCIGGSHGYREDVPHHRHPKHPDEADLMKSKLVVSAVVALSALAGCSSTPDRGS